MSFPRYPEYKDSGVEWLGEVPAHWSTTKVKRLASRISSGKTPLGGSETYVDEGVMFLRSQNVYDDGLRLDDVVFISESTDESMAVSRVIPRDILLNITGASIGRSCIVPQDFPPANVNQHVCAIRLRDESQSQLAAWLFKSALVKNQVDLAQNGAAREGLNFEQIGGMIVAIPPLAEQTAIATFLDRETAKIDALVAEQQKLIALLQEKRQAVISHAVTKGLDPNVPMKDSGVEWLGEVPGHWEAITLRRCALAVQTGGTPSPDALSESLDEGFVWYTPGDFSSSLKLSTSTRRIANESVASGEAKVFPPKSVLIVSIGATLGKVGFAQDTSSANQQINAVIPGARVDGYFLAWSLSVKSEAMRFLSNASTIGIMNQEKTKEIWIALPPREEQTAIATFLDQETTKIDTLVTEARTAITLLQERRTALISAAVTGQIDVRWLAGGADAPDSIAASAYAVSA